MFEGQCFGESPSSSAHQAQAPHRQKNQQYGFPVPQNLFASPHRTESRISRTCWSVWHVFPEVCILARSFPHHLYSQIMTQPMRQRMDCWAAADETLCSHQHQVCILACSFPQHLYSQNVMLTCCECFAHQVQVCILGGLHFPEFESFVNVPISLFKSRCAFWVVCSDNICIQKIIDLSISDAACETIQAVSISDPLQNLATAFAFPRI